MISVMTCRRGVEYDVCAAVLDDSAVSGAWVPSFIEEKRLRHRKASKPAMVRRPQWPGFVLFEMHEGYEDAWPSLKLIRHVRGFIMIGDVIARMRYDDALVGDEIIGEITEVFEEYSDGDTVSITAGPFTGFEGRIERDRVWVNVFGRETPADIPNTWLKKII